LAAFQGAYGVFSVQNFWLPSVGYEGEIRQGKPCRRCRKTGGRTASGLFFGWGGRRMGQKHLESKWIIEQYIHTLALPYTIFRRLPLCG
jgi:hypothetical protein